MPSDVSIAVLGAASLQEALQTKGFPSLLASSAENLLGQKSRSPLRLILIDAGFIGHGEVCHELRGLRSGFPLLDILVWMPRGSAKLVRNLFQAGAKDVVVGQSERQVAAAAADILKGQQILPKVNELSTRRARSSRFESMLSRSAAMWDIFDQCARVAPSNATVLIVGETGTGKELLARAVHRRSGRKGRFVACNCASISEQLIESELFGHEKGAFTDAVRAKQGLVRHAHQGTLFLDEIGDMPENVQVNLLRLLQEMKIRPVGGHEEIPVEVRIVAATNTSLDDAVAQGRFREDLFYRLDVIRLTPPPLRERPEDIVFLFGCFLKKLRSQYGGEGPTPTDGFLHALASYSWPGNVRQLENFTERIVLTAPRKRLTARDFDATIEADSRNDAAAPSAIGSTATVEIDADLTLSENLTPVVADLERRYLDAVLRDNRGRIAESARQAGVSRRTLLRKLTEYGIDKADYK